MGFIRTCTVDVAATPETVHALVGDVRRHPQWAYNRLTVEHVTGPQRGAGARFATEVRDERRGASRPVTGLVDVIEDTPPSRVVFEAENDRGRYRWTFDITATDEGTHVEQVGERLQAPALVLLTQPWLWRLVGRRQVQGALSRLKAAAERVTATPVPPSQRTAGRPVEESRG
jgi:hypothetical protein